MGAYSFQYIPYYLLFISVLCKFHNRNLRFCRIKILRYMWTHAIAIVRYSLSTRPQSFPLQLQNAVIFDIFKNRKYLDISYGNIYSYASIKVFWFWFYNKISTSEKGIKEKRDRQADRQRDWQTDRRTDLHTFWQTKRHAAGGEKEKENETRREK